MFENTAVLRNWIDLDTCNIHADRMDEYKHAADTTDSQAYGAYSRYGLHWDLLEEMLPAVEEIFGIPLAPTYDYSRIYIPGNDLKVHTDRPSCEYSVTVNLRNIGPTWEFFWDGGSCVMNPGDCVAYLGPKIRHWREVNPSSYVYQVFLHYVDPEGEHADMANEYMKAHT